MYNKGIHMFGLFYPQEQTLPPGDTFRKKGESDGQGLE